MEPFCKHDQPTNSQFTLQQQVDLPPKEPLLLSAQPEETVPEEQQPSGTGPGALLKFDQHSNSDA